MERAFFFCLRIYTRCSARNNYLVLSHIVGEDHVIYIHISVARTMSYTYLVLSHIRGEDHVDHNFAMRESGAY